MTCAWTRWGVKTKQVVDGGTTTVEAEGSTSWWRWHQARLEAKEYRETVLEGIKLSAEQLGKGLSTFLSNEEQMRSAALTVSAVALGIYTARVGSR